VADEPKEVNGNGNGNGNGVHAEVSKEKISLDLSTKWLADPAKVVGLGLLVLMVTNVGTSIYDVGWGKPAALKQIADDVKAIHIQEHAAFTENLKTIRDMIKPQRDDASRSATQPNPDERASK
jgi:hypothetical protein